MLRPSTYGVPIYSYVYFLFIENGFPPTRFGDFDGNLVRGFAIVCTRRISIESKIISRTKAETNTYVHCTQYNIMRRIILRTRTIWVFFSVLFFSAPFFLVISLFVLFRFRRRFGRLIRSEFVVCPNVCDRVGHRHYYLRGRRRRVGADRNVRAHTYYRHVV